MIRVLFPLISSSIVETFVFKTVLGTTVKLNGTCYRHKLFAYLLVLRTSWLTSFSLSCNGSHYASLLSGNYCVMTWLLNSLKVKICGSDMFLTTAKEMCDTLNVLYENEKNPSRNFEIYDCLFDLKNRDKSVSEFMKTQESD